MDKIETWIRGAKDGDEEADRRRTVAMVWGSIALPVNLTHYVQILPEEVLRELLVEMAGGPFPIPSKADDPWPSFPPGEKAKLIPCPVLCWCGASAEGHDHGDLPPACKAHCDTCS